MTIPLPIPQHFTCLYYYLPYKPSKKIYQGDVYIKTTDTMMHIKREIASQASEYYEDKVTVYDFVFAQVDKSDFNVVQIFTDDMPAGMLSHNPNHYFMFAYEIPAVVINKNVKALGLKDIPSPQKTI